MAGLNNENNGLVSNTNKEEGGSGSDAKNDWHNTGNEEQVFDQGKNIMKFYTPRL